MNEILTIFNENMEVIGTDSRENVHRFGYWHETFHCWLVHQNDAGERSVYFQLRSPDKDLFPNYLDITAAGHLLAGEDKLEGVREVEEEIGVRLDEKALSYAGIRIDVAKVGDVVNREFCHTYFMETPLEIKELNPDENEVHGLVSVRIEEGLDVFAGRIESARCKAYVFNSATALFEESEFEVTKEKIIPRLDRYYEKVFWAADRVAENSHNAIFI